MKDLALAIFYFLTLDVFLPATLEQSNVTDPEWIAVYELKRDETKEPLLNMRVVIHAKSDGEAVMRSTIFLQTKFGVNVTETLQFVECARRATK